MNSFREDIRSYSNPITGIYSNTVNYQYVQVFQKDSVGNTNGYREYEFSIMPDDYSGDKLPIVSNDWQRGQLLRESVFKNSENGFLKIKETINTYSIDDRVSKEVLGLKVTKYKNVQSYCSTCPAITSSEVFGVANYRFYSKWKHLDRSIVTDYQSNGNITNTTNYFYDNHKYSFSNRQKTDNSNGISEKITKFPLDYTSNSGISGSNDSEISKTLSKMIQSNIINYPIESFHKKEDKIINSKYSVFKDFGNFIKLNKLFSLKIDVPIIQGISLNTTQSDEANKFNPSNIWPVNQVYSDAKDNLYSNLPDMEINYNTNGKIIEVIGKDNYKTSFYWIENHPYPVVEAVNVDYITLEAAINETQQNFKDYLSNNISSLQTESQKSAWKSFNTAIRSKLFANKVLISTYTYLPLVGITSETAPNGTTTYYNYDSFGRLTEVKNDDGKLLKKYQYNYAQ